MIASFKIGRGGQFHNGGHRSFIEFDKTIDHYATDLFPRMPNDIEDYDKKDWENYLDEDGNYTDDFFGLFSGSGNQILDKEDWQKCLDTGCGCLEIDGEYNTVYVKEVANLDSNEIKIIAENISGYLLQECLTEWSNSINRDMVKIAEYFNDLDFLIEMPEDFLKFYEAVSDEPECDFLKIENKFWVKI